jgi:anthranilate phosphoribosyltransferase
VGNVEHGVVVHGCGLDEISPMGGSTIYEIRNTAEAGQPKVYTTNK